MDLVFAEMFECQEAYQTQNGGSHAKSHHIALYTF